MAEKMNNLTGKEWLQESFTIWSNLKKTKEELSSLKSYDNENKNFEELFTKLKTNPLKNQSILIKGSRGMQLERLLEVIN